MNEKDDQTQPPEERDKAKEEQQEKRYAGPDRRGQDPTLKRLRQEIGDEKVLEEKQRESVLGRFFAGMFRIRKNKGLRQVLGGEQAILDEEARASVIATIYHSIQQFFKAGVKVAKEEVEPQKTAQKSFVAQVQREREALDQQQKKR